MWDFNPAQHGGLVSRSRRQTVFRIHIHWFRIQQKTCSNKNLSSSNHLTFFFLFIIIIDFRSGCAQICMMGGLILLFIILDQNIAQRELRIRIRIIPRMCIRYLLYPVCRHLLPWRRTTMAVQRTGTRLDTPSHCQPMHTDASTSKATHAHPCFYAQVQSKTLCCSLILGVRKSQSRT